MACWKIIHLRLIFPAVDLHFYWISHIFPCFSLYFPYDLEFPLVSWLISPAMVLGNTRPPRRPCTPAGRPWWRKSGPWRETRCSLAPLVGNSGKQWPWMWFFALFLLGKSWEKKMETYGESHKLNEGFIDGRISEAKWRILWACSVGGGTLGGSPHFEIGL